MLAPLDSSTSEVAVCVPTETGFFFNVSEHADGERRGRVSVRRHLETRHTETFPTLALGSIQPLGVRRRHAPKGLKKTALTETVNDVGRQQCAYTPM